MRDGLRAGPSRGRRYSLFASWSGFVDPESGIQYYELVGFNQFDAPFTRTSFALGTTLQAVVTAPDTAPMKEGTKYTVQVKAINGAGSGNSTFTDGVTIDLTEPVVGTPELFDTVTGTLLSPTLRREDGSFVAILASHRSSLNVTFSAFDAGSGIKRCGIQVGTFPSGADVMQFAEAVKLSDGRWNVNTTSVTLPPGFSIYTTVTCCDRVLFCTAVAPTWAVVIDEDPPRNGVVCDGFSAFSCIKCVAPLGRWAVCVSACRSRAGAVSTIAL